MTVHPMRPPKVPKPKKRPELLIDKQGGGLTIAFDVPPATVTPFPKK